MNTLLRPFSLLILTAVAAGCTTHVKPTLSKAVVEARAGARTKTASPAACGPLTSPVSVGFGFGETTLNELDVPALENASQQLACHKDAVAVVVGGAEEGHGTEAEQATLAASRAQAVLADLRRRGVPAERISVQTKAPEADARHLIVMAEGRRW